MSYQYQGRQQTGAQRGQQPQQQQHQGLRQQGTIDRSSLQKGGFENEAIG